MMWYEFDYEQFATVKKLSRAFFHYGRVDGGVSFSKRD